MSPGSITPATLCNPPPTWFHPRSGAPILPRRSSSPDRTPSPIPSPARSSFTGWCSEQKDQSMRTRIKSENRSWPRENAKKSKKDWLVLRVEKRPGLFPLKSLLRSSLCALCVLLWQSAMADVRYVDVNSTNATPPYTNWSTAATNIQDAVDAAVADDEVVVTNGIYSTGGREMNNLTFNRVAVDKPLSVRSVNGPQFTIIEGHGALDSRCVYLTNSARLSGFALTNGRAQAPGGGVFCESQTAVVSNCTLTGNQLIGLYGSGGGGAYGGTLNNCLLNGNSSSGAAYCTLNNCTLSGN